jgi:hypothetical protein
MFIEKYTVQVKDVFSKKTKKHAIQANTAVDAHKNALSLCNDLTQDIYKITDYQGNIVYTLANGFNDD